MATGSGIRLAVDPMTETTADDTPMDDTTSDDTTPGASSATEPGTPAVVETVSSAWRRLRAWDEGRDSVPGEHALTRLAGIALIVRPPRDPLLAAGSIVAGFALLARSATGRDGWLPALQRWAERAQGGPEQDFIEVAAPWPYDQRVRVSAPRRTRRSI